MKETIIILGAGVMQGPAIRIAKELKLTTIALDGSSNAPCISMADRFEKIDLKDKEGIETFARSILNNTDRLGIMTAGTDFSASVAWVSEKLNLPGIPYEAALNASDKSRMRACFKKASLPSPDFITITAGDDLSNIALPFPLVIKPVDNMGSRGCRRVNCTKELKEAAKIAIGFSRSGRAIVESYMEGPEFSVDAIIYHGEITICGLADRHIFFPPYFIEMGHTMPTIIEKEKQDQILDTFCDGIRALGLAEKDNIGAAKGDIKLTNLMPMIGEIAARLSGGYMSGWTYPYSSGAQPIKGAILAAMGKKPEGLIPVKTWTCAERAFISIPGTVKEVIGVKQAKEQLHVKDIFLRIEEGSKVTFPENNVTKCGNIIAAAPDRDSAILAGETAARSILIRLDPTDPQTANFLFLHHTETQKDKENKVVFPPDAFQLTDDLKEALNKIPENMMLVRTAGTSSWSELKENLAVIPFPGLTSSNLTDYMGRTVQESLETVRLLTGFPLPVDP